VEQFLYFVRSRATSVRVTIGSRRTASIFMPMPHSAWMVPS
jgi:hypothetical protein